MTCETCGETGHSGTSCPLTQEDANFVGSNNNPNSGFRPQQGWNSKLNWFLITELNPSSCAAIDSKILSLARNFLLMLSLICLSGLKIVIKVNTLLLAEGEVGFGIPTLLRTEARVVGVVHSNEVSFLLSNRARVACVSSFSTSLSCDVRIHKLVGLLERRL